MPSVWSGTPTSQSGASNAATCINDVINSNNFDLKIDVLSLLLYFNHDIWVRSKEYARFLFLAPKGALEIQMFVCHSAILYVCPHYAFKRVLKGLSAS